MVVKVLSLLSGGIDSAVSTYMMIKRGFGLAILHLENSPYSDNRILDKTEILAKLLKGYYGKPLKLYTASHGQNQSEFIEKCDRHLTCLLCKRFMYRIAEQIAVKEDCQAIVTGESIGQVASQTLTNLRAINTAVKIPVLRPLIGLDKQEIMDMAKSIGTYDTSISPGVCCTAVPSKPSTSANLERVIKEEQKLNVDEMIRRTLKTVELKLI
jgi:thiamine biosynthesis protein ThiI